MHSTLKHWPMPLTAWTDIDDLLAEFADHVRREGLVKYRRTLRVARHFLIWLDLSGLAIERVDTGVISRFLKHDCECSNNAPAGSRLRPWRKRRSSPALIRFVRFLEQKGVIKDKRVTPHVLRHSVAMSILQSTGDVRKVSLWLGHANLKTTEMYLRASPVERLQILEAHAPPSIRPGKFVGVEDKLLRLLSE